MSAPDSDIRSAFATKLLAFTSVPSIAWENTAFTPAAGATYLRPTLLTAEPVQAEIGAAGLNRHTGVFQVSIYAPTGTGLLAINTLRNSLIDYFKRGTQLQYGAVTVTISKAFAGAYLQETAWIHVPVTIRYTTLATN